MTHDLRNRFLEHNRGDSSFTNRGKPWMLVYYEAYISKMDAAEEEIFLKSGKGRERLDYYLKESLKKFISGEVA